MLMPACVGLPQLSQRVTLMSLSYVELPLPLRRMPSSPQFLTMTWSTFTRAAAGAKMPLTLAPPPSSVPPETEMLVALDAIWISGTATEDDEALIVAPLATRHSREPRTIPALVTQ